MARIRTFVAVDISSAVRRRAANLQDKLRESKVNASWADPENMHVTLQFLGDVDETEVPEVCKRVIRAAEPHEAMHLSFAQAGAFPALDRPRAVWIRVDEGRQQLIDLQFSIQESLVEMRFPRERRTYQPHLTLGRIREAGPRRDKLAELIAHYHDYGAESCDVTEVLILASYLDRSGPTYQVMGRAPLNG